MSEIRVVGIDPGPVPGFVMRRYIAGGVADTHVVQVNHQLAPVIFRALLDQYPDIPTVVQIERFVVGRRAGASSSAKAGEQTRNLIGRLQELWENHDSTERGRLGGHWFQRSAANVKPWATNERLEAAGLLAPTEGMRHCRDAARHALFAACHDGGVPDPLSKKARTA